MKITFLFSLLFSSFIFSQTFDEINSPLNTRVSVLKINSINELFVGGSSGFYRTNNMGVSWDTILIANVRSLFVYNDSTWFLCTYSGIYKTSDYGEQWLQYGLSIPNNQINDISINNIDTSIFVSTNSGLYKSTDDGVSWNLSTTNYASTAYLNNMVECTNDTVNYVKFIDANSYYQGLFKSTDNGVSWIQSLFPDIGARLRLFKTSLNVLFLNYSFMDNERLYRSTTNGETWDLLINYNSLPYTRYGPIEELEGNLLIMQKRETHNMGTFTSLVISNNNFNTRNTIYPTRIYADNITAFTHSLNNAVFVGIENGKIYKSNDTLTNIEEEIANPKSFLLFQNYPNPFNPSTIISYQLPVAGNVTLKVFDVLGNEIATLVNEDKSVGSYEIEFNPVSSIRHPASGIYFYQLKAGDYIETKKMLLIK